MGARDDFRPEGEFVGVEGIDGGETEAGTIGEATDAEGWVVFAEIATDGIEAEGTAGVEVWDEADAVGGWW